MLVGVIVNNGIVLVDYINQLRLSGMERREAIVEAGVTRLRPILMTSMTTILGLVVMAFGGDAGTALMQPVALVCIGGLLYATLMTLLVVPCMYDILSRREAAEGGGDGPADAGYLMGRGTFPEEFSLIELPFKLIVATAWVPILM